MNFGNIVLRQAATAKTKCGITLVYPRPSLLYHHFFNAHYVLSLIGKHAPQSNQEAAFVGT
jgi:hypothetical protein